MPICEKEDTVLKANENFQLTNPLVPYMALLKLFNSPSYYSLLSHNGGLHMWSCRVHPYAREKCTIPSAWDNFSMALKATNFTF